MQKWEDNPDASRRWDGWVVMDVCIDTFFMCDVIFNFFTGFYESTDEDVVVMHGPDIARRYVKGWLILDILASIPLDVIVLGGNRCARVLAGIFRSLASYFSVYFASATTVAAACTLLPRCV
eukprot:1194474-Prorocentrum_minimum.AAC.6